MDAIEDLIARILAQRKDLTREKILELIEEKRREAHDLLSEEGAGRLVAEELLIEGDRAETVPGITIEKLITGLNDVTLTAKVETIEPVKSFVRQDGSTGKLVRIILADESRKIGFVVWDSKAEEIAKLGNLIGNSLNIKHAYTRAGLTGEVEVNAGDRCEITAVRDQQEHLGAEVIQDHNPNRLAELDSYLESEISELESETERLKSMRQVIRRRVSSTGTVSPRYRN